MTTKNKPALGSPAWLRAQADEKEEMAEAMPSPMFDKEDKREVQGLRDAASRIEKLEHALLSARGGLCVAAIKDGTLDMINETLGPLTTTRPRQP